MSVREQLHSLRLRLAAVLRRARLAQDIDDELRFHLEMRERQYAASGATPEEARLRAERRFGNRTARAEELREAWGFAAVEALLQDVRLALRGMRRSPGFTLVAVLSLAIGVGANAALFSLVSAILLQPLPYPEADRLVRLTGFYPKGAVVGLQEQSRTMEIAGVSSGQEFNLTGDAEAVRVKGGTVSGNLFTLLRRSPALGRVFAAGDERPGRDRIVLLSHALWQDRYGGDPAVVGRVITVEGVERQVVGVMPRGFHFPSRAEQLWVPLRLDPSKVDDYWGFGWMPLVARLRDGASLAQARGELATMIGRVALGFPWPLPRWNEDATALPLQQDLARELRPRLLLLQAAVGLVLLIACANVASLLLSRGAARRKELALRCALGAGRGRILRQLLTESLVLSLLGGAVGVALAEGMLSGLLALGAADAAGFARVGIDWGVLGFVVGLSLLCGLVFGAAPSLSASRVELQAAIKSGGERQAAPVAARLRAGFVAAQVALAVVLAVGAGLLIRTLASLTHADPGFRAAETWALRVTPNPAACDTRAACVALYDGLLRRVRESGGVSDVAAASGVPLDGPQPLLPVELEGHPLAADDAVAPLLWAGGVTPGYFPLMRIPLLRGRAFDDADAEHGAPVVLLSAATARRYWPGQDAVGKRIRVVWDTDWRTVVGVVADVRQYALSGQSPAEITGALYMPYPQAVALDRRIPSAMTLLLRSPADAAELARRVRPVVTAVNPDVPVGELRSLEAVRDASVGEPRSMTWLFAAFASCALLLAAIGSYGLVAWSTTQRGYEIGVRLAMGATRHDVLGLVMGQSLRLVLVGLAIGAAAALVLGRALSSFLYGVGAGDPVTYAAVAGLLTLTALVAGYIPGRRAAATDPVRALRVD